MLCYVTSRSAQTHIIHFQPATNEVFVAIKMEINVKFWNDVAKASVYVCGIMSGLFKSKLRIQYLGSSPPPKKRKNIYYIFMIITFVRKYGLFDIQDVVVTFASQCILKRNLRNLERYLNTLKLLGRSLMLQHAYQTGATSHTTDVLATTCKHTTQTLTTLTLTPHTCVPGVGRSAEGTRGSFSACHVE
jgi:hypothetical protein